MSAISGFINTIRNAVYGEQVRGAIISALEQCYSDVNAPSLQTAAFTAALNAAYAGGILDIQTVTQISSMTNQNIIYRYNGTQAGYQKGLYYYSPLSSAWVLIGSEIHSVSNSSQMTDTNAIYKYTGTQSGMVQNSLYCYNGTTWVPIGSGVLTASTAAGMTNTGAIYKYTGTETGMVQYALYYYNGTAWVLVSDNARVDSELETLRGEIESRVYFTSEITDALINCLNHVAWANASGQSYIHALSEAINGINIDDYTRVEYLKGDGNAYIATDILLPSTFTMTIVAMYTSSVLQNILGVKNSNANNFGLEVFYKDGNTVGAFAGSSSTVQRTNLKDEKGTIVVSGLSNSVKITYTPDGGTAIEGSSQTRTRVWTANPLYLFTTYDGVDVYNNMSGRIYSILIESGGETIASLLPYLDDLGNAGFYDSIGKKFYKNSGSGAFSYGSLQ